MIQSLKTHLTRFPMQNKYFGEQFCSENKFVVLYCIFNQVQIMSNEYQIVTVFKHPTLKKFETI